MDLNAEVEAVIATYPDAAKEKFLVLRNLVFEVAQELCVADLTECLKWGEPSYTCKGGSTLRIHWKPGSPEQIGIFFHCQTRLVETFRELYPQGTYEGNRAFVLGLAQPIPARQVKHCIQLSLVYHKVKHLPLLGA